MISLYENLGQNNIADHSMSFINDFSSRDEISKTLVNGHALGFNAPSCYQPSLQELSMD